MKFITNRELKDKVFKTSIIRVAVIDDACASEEAIYENDFGPVIIEIGGKFEAYVSKENEDSEELTFEAITSDSSQDVKAKANFKFSINTSKVALKDKVVITYSCDAKIEGPRKFEEIAVSALMSAEQKCKIFETVIKDRIKLAVEAWKEQNTTFEIEEIDDLDISLC